MKCVLSGLLGLCGVVFASESVLTRDEVNRGLISLVAKNSIVGRVLVENGHNFEEIKTFITNHKELIDFSYVASPPYTLGMGGPHTALQLACAGEQCSPSVVKLLCQNGAEANKYDGLLTPATHCFILIYNLYMRYGHEDTTNQLYCNQLKKLDFLKEYSPKALLDVTVSPRVLKDLKALRDTLNEDSKGELYIQLITGTNTPVSV